MLPYKCEIKKGIGVTKMSKLIICSNQNILGYFKHVAKGDTIFLEDGVSKKRWINYLEDLEIYENDVNFIEKKEFYNMKGVKFDLIIGNPPYQDDTDCQKLWNKICLKCVSMLNDDGIIAMITPQTVISGSTSSIKAKKPTYQLQQWLQDKEFILYTDEADKHFDVGIPICYWVAKNSNSVNETEFTIAGEVYNKRYLAGKNVVDTLENSIIESVTNSERHQYYRRVRTEFGKKDGYPYKVSDEETDEFRYPVIWNSSKCEYKYTNDRVNCTTKLAMNNYKKWGISEDNFIITDLDVAPSYFSIVGDRDDLEKLRDLLTTKKIFKFVGNKFLNSKGVFLFVQRQGVIPILDLDIDWTDGMLYEEFGLTKEQIDHIESNVE